jgi:hypothetical protein
MSVRDFNIGSILQNHNFVGQIQVFFYDGFLHHQERPIRNHRKYPLWSIRLVLWFASILFNDFSTGFQPAFQPFSSWFLVSVVLDRFFAFF